MLHFCSNIDMCSRFLDMFINFILFSFIEIYHNLSINITHLIIIETTCYDDGISFRFSNIYFTHLRHIARYEPWYCSHRNIQNKRRKRST